MRRIASRISYRYSRSVRFDIDYTLFDVIRDSGYPNAANARRCYDIDIPLQEMLKALCQFYEPQPDWTIEFNNKVNIAGSGRRTARERTEQPYSPDAVLAAE